jgi:mannose-6-phosphate isomerase-like protein (cupin superfamily)
MNNSSTPNLMRDPYLDWVQQEGIPVTEDFGVDLFEVAPKPWTRLSVDGAAVNLKGRADVISMFVLEMPPGTATSEQKHLYEEVLYILSGRGSTTIESADGRKHNFEWGRGSLFAIPMNAKYRHFSGIPSCQAIPSLRGWSATQVFFDPYRR